MEDVNTSWKVATSVVVMSFIIMITVSVLYISKNFWNHAEASVEHAVLNTYDIEAYQLASYGKPVPVASIWKVVNNLTGSTADTPSGTLGSFSIYDGDTLISTNYGDILKYMDSKGYLSYSERAGIFTVSVHLAT